MCVFVCDFCEFLHLLFATLHDVLPPSLFPSFRYGYAQNHVPNTTLVSTVENVVNTALGWGAGYVIFWETMDNECTGGTGCSNAGTGRSRHRTVGAANGAGRCYGPTQVRETKNLNGFWLVKPDGSTSWPFKFFTSKIAESSS